MGQDMELRCALVLLLCTAAVASPRVGTSFTRSAVETVPHHQPIAIPYRASVESIPLRALRDESEGRLPLRDAVERRPIPVLDRESAFKSLEEEETVESAFERQKIYYGAALHLNNSSSNDERLEQGNANLQEMVQTSGAAGPKKLVVCYMESWAAYRAPPLAFTASLVPKSCTHLHYAYAVMHPHTYSVLPANEDYDIVKGGYRIATGLKRKIPGLKVLISVGGEGTDRLFSEMVQEPSRRNMFIESAVSFLQEHGFDGLDLHWVYPGEKDEKEKDMLTAVLYELREKFSSYGYLLSTVLPPFRYQIDDGYDLSAVSGATDYTILQAWDMTHGKRDEPPARAVQHSALHRDPGANSRDQRYDNIEFMVKYVLRHGMAPEKLVLGIPLFGRSYTLAPSAQPTPGAPVNDWGEEGTYTQTKGLLSYFEICMAEREGKGVSGLDEAGNAFAVFENQWVTYDTPNTVLEKMSFVIKSGLAGAAAWSIDMDDFRGLCGSSFPILSAISTSLNGNAVQMDQSSLKIGSCEDDLAYLASDEDSCAHYHFCSGGISYRIICEEGRLYDPSTGFCGHQDVARCMPGQSLRISVADATRLLAQVYESDFEGSELPKKDMSMYSSEPERYTSDDIDSKRTKQSDKKVVCYMTSWAFYRRGDGKFVPERVDARLCTHIVYAYASLSPDELIAKEFDPWTDITNNMYARVTSLKDVKVLLGLGGWTDSAGDKYSRLVSSEPDRANFIQKLIPFLRMHNFNGLHMDWNYPVCWQSNCKKGAKSDKANYATFIQELAKSLHAAGMELGVAISGYKEVIEAAYDLRVISREADFLSTMTYDYHGGWERNTAHHTPLTPSPKDTLAYYSIEYAIKAILDGGADPKKLLLGLSFYGQSYRLADVEGSKGAGSPAAGPGEPGEFTKQPGMLAYYEICYRVKNLRWKTGRQDQAGPYTYSDNQWVGYDDPTSIKEKVEWAMSKGLGGVTAWAIDLDDFNNRCCAEPSPLLRAAGRALGRSVPSPPTTACERPPEPVTPAPPTTTVATDSADGAGGDHHHHHEQTSTTWPSWSPSTTQPTTPSTMQTWWPPATTTTTTTTTKRPYSTSTTTTTTTTTTRKPTTARPSQAGSIEGGTCVAGEYNAAPDDCSGYLQCEAGHWRKHNCAPGLHWAASVNRCDWPSFAKCTATASSQASTATTTLAPTTSRPPMTTRRTTTSTTTTTTTTTTTGKPIISDSDTEGGSCSGEQYKPVVGECGAYLHCDVGSWRKQHCAPGLHWSPTQNHCDWPKYAKCEGTSSQTTTSTTAWSQTKPPRPATTTTTTKRPTQGKEEGSECGEHETNTEASTCDAYLLCVGGHWRKQRCPSGLHWDKRTRRCDWVEFAMCEEKPSATKSPIASPVTSTTTTTTTTTRRPTTTTTKPWADESQVPSKDCTTGTYHTHPKCEKFFVCVNGMLIAQSCAPGLVWRQDRTQCDFPSAASCTDRRQGVSAPLMDATNSESGVMEQVEEPKYCNNGEYAALPSDCSRYQHCLFGKFEEYACSAGLHWNQNKQICDWPSNAKCKKKVTTSTTTTTTTTTTSRPVVDLPPYRPQEQDIEVPYIEEKPIQAVQTGTQPDISSKPALLNSGYKLVCYYTNWSWYRPGIGKYSPEDIDPTLCTHIIYGFAVLGDDGLAMAHDSWADYDNRLYERVVEFKRNGIKVSLGLGGWNDSAGDKYSRLVNDPAARARFVAHMIAFLDKYNFDGLDLDWEYPKCWQVDCSKGPDSDKRAFAELVRELSAELKPRNKLLSAAVSPSKMVIDAGYDVPALARYLDWIAVMTYDYHGQWDKKTGHVAPLYYHPMDDNTYFNANYTMRYWIKKGAPASKLVMGMPMYGQTFTLEVRRSSHRGKEAYGLNTPASAGGEEGEYTRAKGFLSYYEICDRIRYKGWTVVKDPEGRMGPYAFKGNQWVSFDDTDIIKRKVDFIKSLGLGGGMIWALDLDDFRNRCGEGKHPLINTIKNGLLDTRIQEEHKPTRPAKPIKPSKPIHADHYPEPANSIDDLDDIQVKPIYRPPKPQTTSKPYVPPVQSDVMETTKQPMADVSNDVEERYKVVCYYTNWAWYRPGPGKFTPSNIDPSLCTHIVYAFAVLDSARLVIKPHDMWLDVENKFFEKVVSLKSEGVKVVLGLGGWDDSASDKYSRLVNSASARRKFIIHAVDFLEQYEFDGLDLDWEYPKCWQVNCEKGPNSDKEGFANLVKELRAYLKPRGLLLSAAVSASKRVIDVAYDVPTLSDNLDWISLMTYDYHGQWDKQTGHVAPMYAGYDSDDSLNTNFTVHYWINKGADRTKLVMGMPFYGQSFSLMDNVGTGLGAPTYAGGEAGDETRARGFLAYYEICDRVRLMGWQVTRDPGGRMGPYAALEDQWVSFDDDYMIRHKSQYVRALGLGGAMAWSLDLDDFNGRYCGCGKSPLLKTINYVLRGKDAPPSCQLEEIEAPSTETAIALPVTPIEVERTTEMERTTTTYRPVMQPSMASGSGLEGKPCTGVMFKPDSTDCTKYYLCINGEFSQLTCPQPLLWNKNHCDLPEKAPCRKGQLRIAGPEGIVDDEVDKPIIACYFTSWAYYRPGNGSFGPEQMDASLCTHIIYAFAHLDDSFKLIPSIPELDVENDFYGKIVELKQTGVKVILGAGGLKNSEDNKWIRMASSQGNREIFIKSALKMMKKWNFDGLQIAWQYPVCKQAPCSDMSHVSSREDFSALLRELSPLMRIRNLELSAVVTSSPQIASVAYEHQVLATELDWAAIAANDYYASATGKTAYLVPPESDVLAGINNFETSISYWSSMLPSHKLVLTVPAYARTYTLRSSSRATLGAPVSGPGEPGLYTTVPGFLAYYEICEGVNTSEWKETRTEEGTYSVKGRQWGTYFRPAEVHRAGVKAARGMLRGAALWAVDLDDWRASCGCSKHPLLAALRQGFLEPNFPFTIC